MQRESYVQGNSSSPLIGKTIGALLDEVSATDGSREALVVAHQKIRWTYSELKSRSDAFASGLLSLGLEPGDRVGIWAPNCAEWTIAQFATAKAGLILVNINPAYRLGELEHALRAVGCRTLITAARFKTSDYIAMIRELIPELGSGSGELRSSRLPELRHVISIAGKHDGCLAFDWILERGKQVGSRRLDAASATIKMDDAVNIQFTSGTTGLPKGATLSHRNLINNAFFVGEATGIEPGSRVCIPVPLYHCFGMVMGNLGCVTHAATMVYPSESFDPLKTLEAVEAERCDVLYGVPTMFIAQLNHPEFSRFDLSSLRRGIMAGAPCPIEVMKEVASTMHMSEITIAYGMTETSPVSFQSSRDDPLELRVSTVGRIQPHLEVKIVDRDGQIVPRGEAGELCTRGYSVMLGYWNDEARTREAVDSAGWMHTGDLATIDDDGYCRIVGRIKDMVIRGGENLYPREVEEYLYRHPDIQDVQVFGVPAKGNAMDPTMTPEEAADRLAIRELIDAYAHCADRRVANGQMALFTEDTAFHVFMDSRSSEPTYVLHGRSALAPVFADLNQYQATTHFNGQSTIRLDGDRATGDSYCIAHHVTLDDDKRTLMIASIRYLDKFVKQDGAWLFAERRLMVDWTETRSSAP